MKNKIFLTSVLALLVAVPAHAEGYVSQYSNGAYNPANPTCDSGVLGVTSGSVELVADWAVNTYDLVYNLNGGTNNPGNPSTYDIEDTPLTLLAPTKTGYNFGGWYENSGLTGTAVTQLDSTNLPNPDEDGADKELWAKWTIKTDIVCPDGHYLPAGSDDCSANNGDSVCPAGSYCPGNDGQGDTPFTFDDDPSDPQDQGIFACEGNTYSAAGATECTPCPTGQTASNDHTSCGANQIGLSWKVDGVAYTTGNPSANCSYGSGIGTLPTAPTKPGYHFVGWKVADSGNNQGNP